MGKRMGILRGFWRTPEHREKKADGTWPELEKLERTVKLARDRAEPGSV